MHKLSVALAAVLVAAAQASLVPRQANGTYSVPSLSIPSSSGTQAVSPDTQSSPSATESPTSTWSQMPSGVLAALASTTAVSSPSSITPTNSSIAPCTTSCDANGNSTTPTVSSTSNPANIGNSPVNSDVIDVAVAYTLTSGSSTTVVTKTIKTTRTATRYQTISVIPTAAGQVAAAAAESAAPENSPEQNGGGSATSSTVRRTRTRTRTVFVQPTTDAPGSPATGCPAQVTVTVPGPQVTVTVTATGGPQATNPGDHAAPSSSAQASHVPPAPGSPLYLSEPVQNAIQPMSGTSSKKKCKSTGFITKPSASATFRPSPINNGLRPKSRLDWRSNSTPPRKAFGRFLNSLHSFLIYLDMKPITRSHFLMMRHFTSPEQDSDAPDMHPTISEEVQDFIMSSDGDAPGLYNPPPHIAARIYKSRSYHRKSSAASSRRNSMTSHQSSRSGRSAQGRPQSTHIAQHLRRASIIESRKAKAADRNAHAEKVRLRAAMNKAAPRLATDTEERAIAAQQAREKFLAQVKANCAAEVRRSKRVAEEQREKRAAEHLKLKEDMEERHAQAEKRRAMLEQSQRRPRTAASSAADDQAGGKGRKGYVWKPKDEAEAARVIQRAWRERQRRSVLQDFLQLGLTVEAIEKVSFEEAGERLSQEEVISSTTRLLRIFGLRGADDDAAQDKTAARTFLSAFFILAHPEHVLSKEGEQEKDLIARAQELLVQLNRIVEATSDSSRKTKPTELAELSESYASFKTAFSAWRSHDSSFMITNMLAQFVELDAIWQSVKNDTAGEVAADYKEGIQHNQTLVLARLKKLAGPDRAMKLITDAVRASRKAKAKKKSAGGTTPRVASEAPKSSGPSSLAAVQSISTGPVGTTSPSDDRHAAKEKLQSCSLVPDGRVVVHELAINKEWKIDVQQRESKREEIIEATAKRLQHGLDAGLAEVWIPALAHSIQQKLSTMLVPDKPFHTVVSEALDPQMVAQQVRNGSFVYQNFFDFMNSILPKLCAPVRDEEVKALAQQPCDDPVRQLARIYFVIDLLVLDMLNFQFMSIAPVILKESASYEASAFQKALDGRFPDRTLRWWKLATGLAQEEALKRAPESAQLPGSTLTPTRVYMQGLVHLAISTDELSEDDLPETLELDHVRFTRIHSDLLRLVTVSSILLNAKNLLRRDTRSLWKAEAQRMWDLPYSSSPAAFVSIVESRYALPPTTKQQLRNFITRVLAEAREGRSNHPVMKVLLKKIKTHVLTRLSAASAEERIRASTTATEVLASGGMPEFVGRIGDLVHELGRVADVDRETHGEWYDRVAELSAADDAQAAQ
ncbi:MAG: hypothetical protein Q9163_004153 [Psora crenata]